MTEDQFIVVFFTDHCFAVKEESEGRLDRLMLTVSYFDVNAMTHFPSKIGQIFAIISLRFM